MRPTATPIAASKPRGTRAVCPRQFADKNSELKRAPKAIPARPPAIVRSVFRVLPAMTLTMRHPSRGPRKGASETELESHRQLTPLQEKKNHARIAARGWRIEHGFGRVARRMFRLGSTAAHGFECR